MPQLPRIPGRKHVWSRPIDRWRAIALLPPPEVELNRSVLTKRRAFAAFIAVLEATDAHEAARAVWARLSIAKAKRVILPETFLTWRTRRIMAHELVKLGVEAGRHAAPRQYSTGTWWRQEQGRSRFQQDPLKYGYCRHHYGFVLRLRAPSKWAEAGARPRLGDGRKRDIFPPVTPNGIRGWRLVAGVLTALGVSLATANAASGDDCRSVFAAWAAISERQLQQQPASGNAGPGACLQSESVRSNLLKGLERARASCADTSTWLSSGDQTTKSLIDINESFITSLPVCAAHAAEKGPGWATEAAPIEAAPVEAAPVEAAPVVPRRKAAAPVEPAPVEAAPVVPKRKAATPPCLHVSSSKAAELVLSNRRCPGETVLAVVEVSDQAGRSECKAYSIRESFTMRASQKSLPRINHECILNQRSCTKEHISSMFPECEWAGR
jgi:hypothetical protein